MLASGTLLITYYIARSNRKHFLIVYVYIMDMLEVHGGP